MRVNCEVCIVTEVRLPSQLSFVKREHPTYTEDVCARLTTPKVYLIAEPVVKTAEMLRRL
jgi:hypothetical protein